MPGFPKWDKRKKQIMERIRDKTATDSQLLEVIHDLEIHLASETGTLDNYCGVFGKETIENMRKNYPNCVNWSALDGIKDKKLQAIMNTILYHFNRNQCINMSPNFIKLATDYLRNENTDSVANNNVVVVGYPQSDKGKCTCPLPKGK